MLRVDFRLRSFRRYRTTLRQDSLILHRQSPQCLRPHLWEGSSQGKIAHQELYVRGAELRNFVFQRFSFAYYLLFVWGA